MKYRKNNNFQLTSYEDLLGFSDEHDYMGKKIVNISLTELHTFKNHPYKVIEDQAMQELVESIRDNGVMTPIVIRSRVEGGYEIISGHRRSHAAMLLGLIYVPAIIHECSDDEAAIAMVDLNIQRKDILPSEKAKAYKIKYEAMKHQGKKGDQDALDKMAEAAGENRKKIQRYIRLTNLSEELMQMVDERSLGFSQGVDISFMPKHEQQWVFEALQEYDGNLTTFKSSKLKEFSQKEVLNKEQIESIVNAHVPKAEAVTIGKKDIKRVLGNGYDKAFVENLIISLLEQWKKEQGEP